MRKTITAFLAIISLLCCQAWPENSLKGSLPGKLCFQRFRRQFDITLSADHNNQQRKTEIALEALANLWRSHDSKTTVDGGVKVAHSKSAFQTDNTQLSARLDVKFEVGRK
ncbi:PREDICTED: uncharacterized protein LOC108374534 [Rhagoletis zephyria]|uniref:uncharacterized protein LOC108374534 n=1 Tax=Rhagoletis zephyria TaxID=28612 RepID=UPI0008115075|nr:PREDICTED: uncharacterized protein LOC108374534 [Rhagoletis zephyria]